MKKILITGGCGFIGTNASLFFLKKKFKVFVIDDLSRKGSKTNLTFLKNFKNFFFFKKSINNEKFLKSIIIKHKFDLIIHLAGQVAVTTSIKFPEQDMKTNLISTFNILEVIRKYSKKTVLIFASSNKVYGSIKNVKLKKNKTRYYPYKKDFKGIDEDHNLDFHSPYGCSKGAADQYVIDYARIYNLKTFTLRQSCIYGKFQTGLEDQGWIAWIMQRSINKKKINIYGDGKQVRDALYISDLIDLYYKLFKSSKNLKANQFNVGGGLNNSISLIELINWLKKSKQSPIYKFKKRRSGDQNYFVSNNHKITKLTGWKPTTKIEIGLNNLYEWITKKINY
tara:strand:- start:1102 stop:2115 length:1014 start_codon:yes stop_codon:yes gene_type:complete